MNIEEKISSLEQTVKNLEQKIKSANIGRKIEWEDQVSQSGIQVAGPAVVKRSGILLGFNAQIIGPGNVILLTIVQDDKGVIGVISGPFRFVE